MLRQTSMLCIITLLMIMCMKSVCSAQKDDRKSLVYEDVVTTESPVVPGNITTVVFGKHLEAIIKVNYGQHVKFICDINTSSSMEIKWKVNGKTLSAGKVLDIKSLTEEYHGVYITCEVTAQPQFDIFGANILLRGLAPPQINKLTPSKVTVAEKDNLTLTCEFIGGVPPPIVSWHVMKKGEKTFTKLSASGQELVINSVALSDAGMYRCEATNMKGKADKLTELIVQTQPEVVIEEGSSKAVSYGSNVQITCKIVAFPLPKIGWISSKGNFLTSENTYTNNEITSRLNLPKVQDSDTYTCFAENILGTFESSIDVDVMTPFVVGTQSEGVISSKFGSKTDIICDVKSKFPLRIRWFFKNSSGKSEALTSGKYKISAAGTTLTILYTDVEDVGSYSCEASLANDDKKNVGFTTRVQIDDLTPPVLQKTDELVTVKSKEKVKILCTIVGGVPPPVVSWHVIKKGEKTFTNLSASGQELVIDSVALSDAGMYRCEVTNMKGKADKLTELVVKKAPEASIIEGANSTVAYGSTNVFTCRVVGFPLPKVTWKDSKGNDQYAKNTYTNNEITSRLNLPKVQDSDTYTCFAENILGTSESSIDVDVMTPFVVGTQSGGVISSKFGSKTDIICDVKSKFPLRIRWFFKNSSGKSEALTSGKYKISAAGTTLTILYTDVEDVGSYFCEASLANDDKKNVGFTTRVQIDDLTTPVLQKTYELVTVKSKEKVKILCTIVGGVPPPVVSWHVMKKGEKTFTNFSASGQELVIDSVALSDAGMYRCEVTNMKGKADKLTELVVKKAPEASIIEGANSTVAYGSTNVFTCRVVGFPLPKVTWKDSKGNDQYAKNTYTNNEITSRLNLPKVQDSDTYTCFAKNILGTSESSIDVDVMTPFVVGTQSGGVISSKFGSKTDIICDVKSKFPLRIKWFFKNSSGKSEALTSGKYKISAAGTTLTILYTDVEDVGSYFCEASLANDDKKNVGFTTRVQIDDLTTPVLQKTYELVTVKSKEKVKILCTIVGGVPPPVVSWHVMKKGEKTFTNLSASGQELVIDSVALSDAGMYRCEVTNMKGKADKLTELVVKKAPEASIIEGANSTVAYGSTNVFTCRVVGFPLPKVTWKDSKGNDQYAKNDIDIINNEVRSRLTVRNIKSSDTYTCHAANDLGQETSSVQVSVFPAIDFPTHPPETITVKHEEPTTIHCDAKSSMPMKIKWYYQKDEHSPRSEIFTSDKYSISSDEHDLLIVSTCLDLVGKYTCEAYLVDDESEKKSFTTNVEINNLKVPEITFSNKTITTKKGGIMSAFCIADGIPKPEVTWQFKSIASDVFIAMPDKGERIFDPNIGYEKAGLYTCTATNALGADNRTIDVVVNGVPRITNNDTVYYGVTGDKVLRIPCEVDGFPEPTITWKKEGKVVTSDAKLSISKNAIYIKNPTEQDSTNLTCKAKNTNGHDTKNFEADISDFVTYNEIFNRNIYLKLGESTDLKCNLPHSDPQSIRWYVNGESTKFFGTFYSIKNAQYSNDGNYTCRLNTDEGSESLNYVVDVGYEPRFKADASAIIDWQGNKKDMLDCDVYAKPSAKVEWFYKGKPLNKEWPELAIVGWGQYSCRASNVHDSVQRTFNVTSNGCLINRTAVNVDRTPLLIDDEQTTWPAFVTTNEFYTMTPDETITLECATLDQPDNTFKTFPKIQRINAKCHAEDQFMIDGKTYKFSDLQCKSYVKPSQVFTKTSCMENGEVIEVGFNLVKGFLRVYEVCYSGTNSRTLYTKMVMSAVNSGNIVTPSFKHRETKGGRHSEPGECAYSMRWLVNPEDVAFGPAQTATLSDQYNTAAVYEPCKNSSRWSWSGVEKSVEFSLYSSDTVTVWTGASQHDSSGIPRYLWKVVLFDDDTFETIVYVNAANPSHNDNLCRETVPDRLTDVTEAGDRFTYACSMDDFLKAFKIPLTQFT